MKIKEYYKAFAEEELVKGAEIYYANEIEHIEYHDCIVNKNEMNLLGNVISISGKFQERNKNYKSVEKQCEIIVSDRLHMICETNCNCEGFQKDLYGCKHTAALLTAYLIKENGDEVLRGTRIEEQLQKLTLVDDPFQEGVLKRTDERIRSLLTGYETQSLPKWHEPVRKKDLMKAEYGLTLSPEGVLLEIKIGTGRNYVIKNIFQFLECYRTQEYYMLGKKEYQIGAAYFEPTTRKILNFLSDLLVAAERGNYKKELVSKTRETKYIILADKELDMFLQLVNGTTIRINEMILGINLEKKGLEATIRKKTYGASLQIAKMSPFCNTGSWIYICDFVDLFRIPFRSMKQLEQIFALSEWNEQMYIRESDIGMVLRQVLPMFEESGKLVTKGIDLEHYELEKPTYEFQLDYTKKGELTCIPYAIYQTLALKCCIFDQECAIGTRNAKEETKVATFLTEIFQSIDKKKGMLTTYLEEDELYDFMKEKLPELEKMGIVMATDAIKKCRVAELPKMNLGVKVEAGKLLLSLEGTGLSVSEMDEILNGYTKKKKYYRLKSGEFISLEEERDAKMWDIVSELYQHYGQKNPEKISLPLYRALYLHEMVDRQEEAFVEMNDEYKKLISSMQIADEKKCKVPASLKNIIRPYQKEGFLWINTLKKCGFGGILADDMGLGKTLQVLTFLLSEKGKKKKKDEIRTLIVTPASLVYNWRKEIESYTPELKTVVLAGNITNRKKIIETNQDADVWITSYDLLKRDIELYENVHFANEIIDEAQYIKNYNTQVSQAVRVINSDFRLALTGTPIENHLSELWSIMDYLMPGFLYSNQRFQKDYEIPIVTEQNQDILDKMRRLVHPFILRRLKKQVLQDLPEKQEEVITVRLSDEQKKIYDANVEKIRLALDKTSPEEFKSGKLEFLAQLTKLRQICCDPSLLYEEYEGESAKLDACMQLVVQAIDGGHKLLIFSQFTSMLDIICNRLQKEEIAYHRIDGSVDKEKRMQMVDSFANDDVQVFCISLKAGGTGLNLTAADIVIHYDPWWNQAAQNQATDRAHRIGQKNHVSVYELISENTIEERIQKIKESKAKLVEDVLSGESISSSFIDKDDMLALLEA